MFHAHSCLDSLFMPVYINYFRPTVKPRKSLLKIELRIALVSMVANFGLLARVGRKYSLVPKLGQMVGQGPRLMMM